MPDEKAAEYTVDPAVFQGEIEWADGLAQRAPVSTDESMALGYLLGELLRNGYGFEWIVNVLCQADDKHGGHVVWCEGHKKR